MIYVPCETCRAGRLCRDYAALHRAAFFAAGDGRSVECAEYRPRWFRGVEGVLDGPHAPSGVSGGQR